MSMNERNQRQLESLGKIRDLLEEKISRVRMQMQTEDRENEKLRMERLLESDTRELNKLKAEMAELGDDSTIITPTNSASPLVSPSPPPQTEIHIPYVWSSDNVTTPELKIYISYAWGGDSETLVNSLDKAFEASGITIIRDKRDLIYKGRIKQFMEEIGRGKYVIIVISDKYLRSKNCMFELLEIAKHGNLDIRVFPIVLDDANIYEATNRIQYIKHWELKIGELEAAMKEVGSANMQGIREEIDLYTEVRKSIAGLTDFIQDMNTLTPEMHENQHFEALFGALDQQIKADQNAPS